MPVLISSNHLLKENNSEYKNNLEFSYYPEFSHSKNGHKKRIDLSSPRLIYQNKNLDITIIEIIEEDNLDIYSFLEMDNSINTDNPIMLYKKIYILHYPLENKEENYSHEKTTEAIFQCHRYFRQIYDPSAASLRDISRFLKIFDKIVKQKRLY